MPVTPSEWRGILVPDTRLTFADLSAEDSSYSETTTKADTPVDAGSSSMVLQARGTRTSTDDLLIYANKGGYPGVYERGGGFLWRYDADVAEVWRGWNAPNSMWGHHWPGWSDGSAQEYGQPHVIRLKSDVVLAAFRRDEVLLSPSDRIGIATLSTADSWTWGTATITPSGDDGHNHPWPCLLQLSDSGRVLCFFWVKDSTNDLAQVQSWYSDDDGATWALASRYALDTSIGTEASTGYNLRRLRAAYSPSSGQILLVAHIKSRDGSAERDAFAQYASDDEGATFTQVEVTDHTDSDGNTGQHDVVALETGGFLVGYARHKATTVYEVRYRPLGSAYTTLSSIASVAGQNNTVQEDGFAMWRGQDSTIYVMTVGDDAIDSLVRVERSTDNGSTWAYLDDDNGASTTPRAMWMGQTGTMVENVTACEAFGRVVCLHTQVTSGGPNSFEDDSIGAFYLGGSSTVPMPSRQLFQRDSLQDGWYNTWVSISEPGTIGHYTKTTGGSPTESLVSTGLRTASSATTDTIYYTKTGMSSDIDDCLIVLVYCTAIGGATGATSNRQRSITLRAADNTEHYEVDINIGTTEFEVHDANGSPPSIIDSAVTVSSTGGIWVLAALRGSNIATWYRTGGPGHDLEWSIGPATDSLTDGGGGTADFKVVFGDQDTAGVTTTTDWHQVSYGVHLGNVSLSEGAPDTPAAFSRPFSASWLAVDDGVSIRAVDGPAVVADQWSVSSRAEFGVREIHPAISPSPRVVWRSTDTTQQQIAWTLDAVAKSYSETEFYGLYLGGINFADATLEGYDGAAWQTLATIDAKLEGSTVSYARNGEMVTISAGATDHTEGWCQYHELVGGSFYLDASTVRRIAHNTEGRWNKDAMYPRIYLEDVDSGDPGSGTGEIWAPNVCTTYIDTTGRITKLRLTISSQTTADGYFEIGTMLWGRVIPFPQYSHGRAVEIVPNVDVQTLRDGTRYSRKQGPARRRVMFSWDEGLDTSPIYSTTAPDYFDWSNNRIGTPAAVPLTLEGVYHRFGADHPMVYLPKITTGRPTLRYREEMIYGRLMRDYRREVVVGDEASSEVFRISPLNFDEEL